MKGSGWREEKQLTAVDRLAASGTHRLPWTLPAVAGLIGGILLTLGSGWGWLALAAGVGLLALEPRPMLAALLLAGGLTGVASTSSVLRQPDRMPPWIGAQVTLRGDWDGQFLKIDDPPARVVLAPKPDRPPGQLTVSGRLVRPTGQRTPGGFDQAAWLRTQGGVFTLTPTSVLVAARVRSGQPEGGLRGHFRRGLTVGLNERQAALMTAIELGDRNDIGRENFAEGYSVRDAFSRAGLAHLMALSGQNVALLTGAVILAIRMLNVPLWVRYGLPLLLLFPYLFGLVGVSPSIFRAVLMGGMVLLGLLLGRGKHRTLADALGLIALAALVSLALYPLWLLDIGFRLSFLAVLGLSLSGRLAERLPAGWPLWLRLALSATILAELATLPLIASNFGQIPLVGLPANLLAGAVMSVLVPLGFVAGLLGPLAGAVNWLVGPLASLLLWLADFFGRALVLPWGHISPAGYTAYAVAAAGGVLWLLGKVRGQVALALLLGCTALTALPPLLRPARELVFLDVGQGDATLIRARRFNMLVDGGGSVGSDYDVGGRTVLPALRSLGVRSLDVVVATHADTDHIEGLESVLRGMKVGELWIGQRKADDPVLAPVLRAATERGVPIREVRRGDQIEADGVKVTVLWPKGDIWSSADNENSVALGLESHGWRSVLLGDLPDPTELYLGAGRVNLLKAAHHGSRFSTSAALLRQVQPKDVLISVGRNTYGHPHPDVLQRLNDAGAKVWRTDELGTVRWPLP